ncbi:MAG: CHASE2 domain-containing protein [Armatimonadia bacterium]|nr:CHASE2 domain-containing protein [Armatimonadia bacterium]
MPEYGDARAESRSSDRRRLALIVAAITILVLLLRFWPAFNPLDGLELQTIDWRFHHRGFEQPDPRITIVAVDEASILDVGRWPWPRDTFARVVRTLDQAGAQAIVFDIFFSEPDDASEGEAGDRALVEATREAGNVYHAAFGHAPDSGEGGETADILAERSWSETRVVQPGGLNAVADIFEIDQVTPPLPSLVDSAAGIGFVNVVDSGDGVFRHTLPLVARGPQLYPSLSVSAAAGVLGVSPDQVVVRPGQTIDLGERRSIPIDRMGRMLIDFAGGTGTYPYVPVKDVLSMDGGYSEDARDRFEDRIVFVAVTAPGLYDLRASPFDSVYYGVETQANALANILQDRFLRQAPGEVCVILVIVLAAAVYLVMIYMRPRWAVMSAIGLMVAYNWIAVWLFSRGLVIEVIAPDLVLIAATLAGLALRLVGQESEGERVWSALARFVPAEVIGRVVTEDPEALLRGQRREVSVMFADIRSFTEKSASLSPEQSVELLNRFFFLVHETIFEHEGTLDKYMGDGLMAFWNSPLDQPDHALLAVQTAVHMQRRLQYNQAEWEFLGMPELAAGIGISTGDAVVGYVGTGERMQYTAIGAQVNLAARLETLTKELGCPILISDATYEQVKDHVEARSLGPMEVRGFSDPVEIYEVLDLKE